MRETTLALRPILERMMRRVQTDHGWFPGHSLVVSRAALLACASVANDCRRTSHGPCAPRRIMHSITRSQRSNILMQSRVYMA